MRYRGLDLNLLVALDALLRTSSVSEAAKIVHVTQPAMSAALARLRSHYGDALLVPRRGRSVLTPFAEALRDPVRDALRRIDRTLIVPPGFDWTTSSRQFRLLAADTVILGLLAAPLRAIGRLAPGVRIELATPRQDHRERLSRHDIDLLIVPDFVTVPDFPKADLIEEDHCVVACADNDLPALTCAAFEEADHVEVFLGSPPRPFLADTILTDLGLSRRIAVRLDSFLLVPEFVVGTRRLATVSGLTAEVFTHTSRLRQLALPFALPPIKIVMQWHPDAQGDEGLAWLRAQIASEAQLTLSAHKSRLYRWLPEAI